MSNGSLVSPAVRDRFRRGVEPIALGFGRVGLTPNALTLIGFGIAIVAAWVAAQQEWLAAGLLVAFGAVFDLFDGALARATGRTSKLGAFMDSVFDRAAEAVVYIGVAVGLMNSVEPGGSAPVGVAVTFYAMAAAFMVSYTRAKAESLGFTPGRGMANVGLAPREVRTVILVVALLVAGILRPPTIGPLPDPPTYLYWWFVLVGALALIAVLATLTTIQRIVHVVREARNQEHQ